MTHTRLDHPVMSCSLADDGLLRVYDDLRRMARAHMRFEATDHTLSATGLVHEVWIRLHATDPARASDPVQARNWFLGMAARLFRQVLVDHARRRRSLKRGGDLRRIPLFDDAATADAPESDRSAEILAIHEALELLRKIDPFQCEVAELRLFGGLTLEQVALVTQRPLRQVRTRWQLARAWLSTRVRREGSAPACDPTADE
ncbi:MAG: RNA polymerase subunit sigma-70 [Phycisphaerales bacterium]|nr:RNA polymerase subunit sigma-70 [Phycisphaerales bacterium]